MENAQEMLELIRKETNLQPTTTENEVKISSTGFRLIRNKIVPFEINTTVKFNEATFREEITIHNVVNMISKEEDFEIFKNTKSIDNTAIIIKKLEKFVQRAPLLEKLHREVKTLNTKVFHIAITGFPGIGKTVLAQNYADYINTKDSRIYKTCWYIRAGEQDTRFEDYKKFAEMLEITLRNDTKLEEITKRVNQRLSRRDGFVLIFDNVKSYKDIAQYIPNNQDQELNGYVIITSRNNNILPYEKRKVGISLNLNNGLDEDEAIELLNGSVDRKYKNDNGIIKLIKKIGGVPLLLAQANTYILKKQCDYDEYMSKYNRKKLKLLREQKLPKVYKENSYEKDAGNNSIKNYIDIIRVFISFLSSKAKQILYLSSYHKHDSISIALFSQRKELEALRELENYSLIVLKDSSHFFINKGLQVIIKMIIKEEDVIFKDNKYEKLYKDNLKERMATIYPDEKDRSESRLLKITLNKEKLSLEGYKDDVNALSVLPNGNVVSGSNDDTLKVWHFPEEKLLLNREALLSSQLKAILWQNELILKGKGEDAKQELAFQSAIAWLRIRLKNKILHIEQKENPKVLKILLKAEAISLAKDLLQDLHIPVKVLSLDREASIPLNKGPLVANKFWGEGNPACSDEIAYHFLSFLSPRALLWAAPLVNKLWYQLATYEMLLPCRIAAAKAIVQEEYEGIAKRIDKAIAETLDSFQELLKKLQEEVQHILECIKESKLSLTQYQAMVVNTDANVPKTIQAYFNTMKEYLRQRPFTLAEVSLLRQLMPFLMTPFETEEPNLIKISEENKHAVVEQIPVLEIPKRSDKEELPLPPLASHTGNLWEAWQIDYEEIEFDKKKLGEGGEGIVCKGTYRNNPVAIKRLKLTQPSSVELEEFKEEMKIMFKLHSPQIVQLYGVYLSRSLGIVMEYMPKGSLYQVLQSKEPLDWSKRYRIAIDMTKGLSFLHKENLLHKDLKSPNVLINEHWQAKLSDFGIAEFQDKKESLTSNKGSLLWIAPERLRREKHTKASDVYSLGITLWELSSRELPFKNLKEVDKIKHYIKEGKQAEALPIPQDCPTQLKKIIPLCWLMEAKSRPTADEVLKQLEAKDETEATLLDPGTHSIQISSNII